MNSESNSKLFEEIFSEEIISNERFRSKLLAGIVGFMIIIVLLVSFVYTEKLKVTSQFKVIIEMTLIILAFVLLRALVISRVAKRWNRFGIRVFIIIRYINAFIEISIPSTALIIYSFHLPSVYPLLTPVSLLYFLIIMLSSLELDFKLSLFSGSLAAVQYSLIVWYLLNKPSSDVLFEESTFYPAYLGIAALLFISGHTSGLISNQIKRGLLNHYKAQNERNEIQRLFGQQISKEIVDHLVENKYQVVSKVRHVAIMFLDIENFSQFAENRSPEQIIRYQNDIFSFMIEIVNKHKGIINQILGDGFMAIFGAPIEHENDCQLAVNAALEIQKTLEQRNKDRSITLTNVRIGINAGLVVTGNVGTEERKQYSITGKPVIIAARLEQLNKELNSKILISKEVYDKINIDVKDQLTEMTVNIKGLKEPVTVYKLL